MGGSSSSRSLPAITPPPSRGTKEGEGISVEGQPDRQIIEVGTGQRDLNLIILLSSSSASGGVPIGFWWSGTALADLPEDQVIRSEDGKCTGVVTSCAAMGTGSGSCCLRRAWLGESILDFGHGSIGIGIGIGIGLPAAAQFPPSG